MIRITVYAGPATADVLGGLSSTKVHEVEDSAVHEILRSIGLEWKTADYFPRRQVVITLDPVVDEPKAKIRELIRDAALALEETGML